MRPHLLLLLCFAVIFSFTGRLSAQMTVQVKEVKPDAYQTPKFTVTTKDDKRWTPKLWLVVDVALDIKKAKSAESLDFKFFVGLNAIDPMTKKNFVLTGTMTALNASTKPGEHAHVLVFVSPNTLHRVFGDNHTLNATGDVKAIGIEISSGGAPVGGYPLGQGKWWEDLGKFSPVDGLLLSKSKTPFSPMWGDYDLEIK